MSATDLDDLRTSVRRRAVANFVLLLGAVARRTRGRLALRPVAGDALLLAYRDVRTLVRTAVGYRFGPRDVEVVIGIPSCWPFERAEALQPFIVRPDDFAHPNSDGRALCLDLQGVTPERLPGVLYDNLVLRSTRLDHCMDLMAADFVRTHLAEVPTDRRPLFPGEAMP
jgi:hypothetical protein